MYNHDQFVIFQNAEQAYTELEAAAIQYNVSVDYVIQEFIVDGILWIDPNYVAPACAN